MSWMYQLIRDEGKIKLCELYRLESSLFYCPVSVVKSLKDIKYIISDLLNQRNELGLIPEGEFLTEQIYEYLYYRKVYKG